jgi:hypothetical protein
MLTKNLKKASTKNKNLPRLLTKKFSSHIESSSFIHEYKDDYYPQTNKNQYQLYKEANLPKIQGSATLKGTELYSHRNPESTLKKLL